MKIIIKGRLWKLVSVFLIVGFLLQPVQQAFASETDSVSSDSAISSDMISSAQSESAKEAGEVVSEPVQTSGDGVSVGNSNSGDTENIEPKTEPVEETEDTTTIEKETTVDAIPEPPASSEMLLPPTTIKQKIPDADIASGALVYGYALGIPKGRSGAEPSLNLSYNSQNSEEGSSVGFGWNLDLPSIERKNVDGLQKLYTSENFTSSLDGDLRKTGVNGAVRSFSAKIDGGNFSKYEFVDNATGGAWTLKTKTGTKYTFGSTDDSRLSNPADASKVFRWHLTRQEDKNGNFVSYEYTKQNGQVYPLVIKYSGNGTDSGIYSVRFNLQDRPDKTMSAKYGFMATDTKRVQNIEVYVSNILAGRYSLGYSTESVNKRSLLSSIVFAGFDADGVSVSDGETQFSYGGANEMDLLTKIKQNTGGETTVKYKSSAQYRDASGALQNPKLPFAIKTVSRIDYDDKNGVVWHNDFNYFGGWFYYNGPMDRRFVGFEKVVRTDSVDNTMTSFYHQGNGENVNYGESSDDWSKAGKVYRVELRDAQGNLFSQTLNTWQFNKFSGSTSTDERAFTRLSDTVTRIFDGNATHKDRANSFIYEVSTGNLVSTVDYGEVIGADNGTFQDVGTDKVTSDYLYAVPETGGDANLIGIIYQKTTKDYNNSKISEVKNYFDTLPLGKISLGNVTREENWISGTTYATINRVFNNLGLPVSETDPLGHVTTYMYDSMNLYTVSVTNAAQQVTSYEYDYRFGQVVKTIDPNGAISKISLDALGRSVKEEYSDPAQTLPTSLFTKKIVSYDLYSQNGGVVGWKTVETNFLDETTTTLPRTNKSITYTDGFGRTVQTRTQAEAVIGATSERYTAVDTIYNNIGQVAKTSLPYFSDNDVRTIANADQRLFVSLSYDSVYRVVSTTNVIGNSTNNYDDWKVTTTDANGKIKSLYKDAFDKLVRVDEHNGNNTYTTKYTYDGMGNLVKIVDALNNVRNFTYDGLGRRTKAEDLHASGDSTFGIWNYQYNLVGNLESRSDANGTKVLYSYDVLNRVVTENVGGNITTTYTYDTCPKGIGRVCSVVNSALTQSSEYNILGQVVKETKVINSQTFINESSYDRQGSVVKIKNPDSSEIKYSYNVAGQVDSVQSKESGSSNFGNVVLNIDYTPTGSISNEEYANGGKTVNTYDLGQMYRLINKRTTLPLGEGTKTVQNLNYTYDAVGNILSINDISELNTRKTTNYAYDDLYRLTNAWTSHAAAGQNYVQSYSYDAIGNITYKSDVGNYSYDGSTGDSYANPHAVTSVSGTVNKTFEYDKNGNVVDDTTNAYEWDYNNRIKSITQHGIVALPNLYGYDAGGARVSVSTSGGSGSGGVTTLYPSKMFNTTGGVTGAGVQKHIFAGEELVATIKGVGASSAMYMLHSDHLGSVRVTSGASGAIAEETDYLPFGAIRHNANPLGGPEQRKYTGHEYDVDTGLNYADSRYYNPGIGRFVSQDPAFWNMSHLQDQLVDPQSWNSYAYARNNPLAFTDPNGQFWTPWQSSGGFTNWMGNGGFLHNIYGNNVNNISNQVQNIVTYGPTKQNVTAIVKQTGLVAAKTAGVAAGALAVGAGAGVVANFVAPAAVAPVATTTGTACVSGGCQKAQEVVNEGINLTSQGMLHAQKFHSLESTIVNPSTVNKSYFYNFSDVPDLIQKASGVEPVEQFGKLYRVVNSAQSIGVNRATQQPTSSYTVITDRFNNLINTFPGIANNLLRTRR